MKYEAVIFDLFGTLVSPFSFQKHEQTLSEMAAILEISPQDFARMFEDETRYMRETGGFITIAANIEYICQQLNVQVEAEKVAEAAQMRLNFTRHTLTPRPDATETVTKLKTTGHKTGLISDCSPEVPYLWQELPFASLVEAPIFSCSVKLKKPDPRIYRLACERLEVTPQSCLYVGDGGSQELTGALEVGMHPVLIRGSLEDTYDAYRPDVEEWQGDKVSTLSDILTLIGSKPLE